MVTPTGEICANEIRRFCCYKFANQIIACLTERNVATKMNQRGDKKQPKQQLVGRKSHKKRPQKKKNFVKTIAKRATAMKLYS